MIWLGGKNPSIMAFRLSQASGPLVCQTCRQKVGNARLNSKHRGFSRRISRARVTRPRVFGETAGTLSLHTAPLAEIFRLGSADRKVRPIPTDPSSGRNAATDEPPLGVVSASDRQRPLVKC